MILFVDNELYRVREWVDALREEFSADAVKTIDNAPDAMAFLVSPEAEAVRTLVCDLMMPTGPGIDLVKAEQGTRTGLIVFDEFRTRFPERPAIILTNVHDETLIAEHNSGLVRAGRKQDLLPDDLVDLVKHLNRMALQGSDTD